MPREVIMPALGMAQETGRLVAWLKSPGDRVASDDPLMEVETDKSVMEVPAGADGTLGDLRAKAGDDVPVGDVIALIYADGEGASDAEPAVAPDPSTMPEPEPAVEEPPVARPVPTPRVDAPRVRSDGRILASPKARRLALERGIDLAALVAGGATEPLHAADVADAAVLPSVAPAAQIAARQNVLTSRCSRAAFDGFLAAMADRTSIVLEPHVLIAAFAASSLRPDHGTTTLSVAVEAGRAMTRVLYSDPDLTRPSRPRMAADGTQPDVILRDLTWSRLTGATLPDRAPALTLGSGDDCFVLTLTYPDDTLTLASAIDLLDGMVERLENPMENLV